MFSCFVFLAILLAVYLSAVTDWLERRFGMRALARADTDGRGDHRGCRERRGSAGPP